MRVHPQGERVAQCGPAFRTRTASIFPQIFSYCGAAEGWPRITANFGKESKPGVPLNFSSNRSNRTEYVDSRIRFHFLILVHPFGACYWHGPAGWRECAD